MITLDVAKSLFLGALMIPWVHSAGAAVPVADELLPTGQVLHHDGGAGSASLRRSTRTSRMRRGIVAGQTISEALSPDRKTLLVLTSGYNLQPPPGSARPFASGRLSGVRIRLRRGRGSRRTQTGIAGAQYYVGIAFAPSGDRFVVSGGVDERCMSSSTCGRVA